MEILGLLGNKDPRGKIIFTILTDHKYKKCERLNYVYSRVINFN